MSFLFALVVRCGLSVGRRFGDEGRQRRVRGALAMRLAIAAAAMFLAGISIRFGSGLEPLAAILTLIWAPVAAAVLAFPVRLALLLLLAGPRLGAGFGILAERFVRIGTIDGRQLAGVIGDDGDPLLRQFLDRAQERAFLAGTERHRDSGGAGAGRPADSVHISFRHVRQVVVDDMADARDVDAARGDVSGDENARPARPERIKSAFALALRAVAVNGVSFRAGGVQRFHHLVGAVLGPGEHETAREFFGADDVEQRFGLGAFLDEDDALVDLQRLSGGDLDAHRIAQQTGGQLGDRRRHGRRQENILAFRRQRCGDGADRMNESEIEHLVDFVKDEDFNLIEADGVLFHEVRKTTRGRHKNVDAVADHGFLLAHGGAADDEAAAQFHELAVGAETLKHLRGEFARRRQHQHAAVAAALFALRFSQMVQDRQRERRRFAGPGLGDAEKVMPLHQGRNGAGLDRRRRCMTLIGERLHDRLCEAEIVKLCQNNLSTRRRGYNPRATLGSREPACQGAQFFRVKGPTEQFRLHAAHRVFCSEWVNET